MKSKIDGIRTAGIVSGALFAVLCLMFALFPRLSGMNQIWKGYTLLLVDATVPPETVSEALLDAGYRDFLSPDRARVTVSEFEENETVPVAGLRGRFDPEDPRVDPYVSGLPFLFSTADSGKLYTVYYLSSKGVSSVSPFRLKKAIQQHAPGASVRFPENTAGKRVAWLVFYAAFAFLMLRKSWKDALLLLPGVLSFTLLLLSDGRFAFPAACILSALWVRFMNTIRDYAIRRMNYPDSLKADPALLLNGGRFAVIFPAYIALEMLPLHGEGAAGAGVVVFFASLCAGVWYASVVVRRQDLNMHRLFIPVSIRYGKQAASKKISREAVVLACIVVAGPFPAELFSTAVSSRVPVFTPAGIGDGFSWGAIERLQKRRTASMLPDISEFVAHCAYLEGFAYGRDFGFPDSGESVSLPDYSMEKDGSVVEREKTLGTFDSEWLEGVLEGIQPGSPEKLFLAQGRPGWVRYGSVSTSRLSVEYLAVHLLFCLLAAALLSIPAANLTSPSLYGMRSTVLRRDRQVV